MLALRPHLDDADDSNGAPRVIPGTHRGGKLGAADIRARKESGRSVTCAVPKGGVMSMRPLLPHSPSAGPAPAHRRVLHFEYSAAGLAWFDGGD